MVETSDDIRLSQHVMGLQMAAATMRYRLRQDDARRH